MLSRSRTFAVIAVSALAILAFPGSSSADHSWGGYHWARTSNPFTLKLGDNLSSAWDPYLATTSSDWSQSSVLDTTIVPGLARNKQCKATSGRAEVYNGYYGQTGWLGIAQIWLSGCHISQGIVKVNDTYYDRAAYNTPAEKNHVMCQEVGHIFGLDHQDESGASLGTCMDYADDSTWSQHPNQHDYDQLEAIYAHTDSTTTIKSGAASSGRQGRGHPRAWGRLVEGHHGHATYVRELAGGGKLVTFVTWAD